jgi:hypothetical protein
LTSIRTRTLFRKSLDTVYLQNHRAQTSRTFVSQPVDPLPGRALHTDLLDRFKSLKGNPTSSNEEPTISNEKHEDDKTVEELLADLGPAEQWDVGKSEQDEVDDLLRSATSALQHRPEHEPIPGEDGDDSQQQPPRPVQQMPGIDVSIFQPEPESDEEAEPRQNKAQLRDDVNQEADDVLQRLMDEVKFEQQIHESTKTDPHSGSESDDEGKSKLALPSAGSQPLPSSPPAQSTTANTDIDSALAARFASLSRPSTTSQADSSSQLPSAPSSLPTLKPTKPRHTDEEIDTWCIICLDDATLQCIGCDGDLYCRNCWMEGHTGEDAGMEERRHKAVEYVKGKKKKKKTANRRVAMGA